MFPSPLKLRRTDSMADQVQESVERRVVWVISQDAQVNESVFSWLRHRGVSDDFVGPVFLDGQQYVIDFQREFDDE